MALNRRLSNLPTDIGLRTTTTYKYSSMPHPLSILIRGKRTRLLESLFTGMHRTSLGTNSRTQLADAMKPRGELGGWKPAPKGR